MKEFEAIINIVESVLLGMLIIGAQISANIMIKSFGGI